MRFKLKNITRHCCLPADPEGEVESNVSPIEKIRFMIPPR